MFTCVHVMFTCTCGVYMWCLHVHVVFTSACGFTYSCVGTASTHARGFTCALHVHVISTNHNEHVPMEQLYNHKAVIIMC